MAAAAACTRDAEELAPAVQPDSDSDGIAVALRFPEMESVVTRALGERNDEEKLKELKLYLFLFEEDASASIGVNRFISVVEAQPSDAADNYQNGIIIFDKVLLAQTDRNAVVHLIATSDPDFKIPSVGFNERDMMSSFISGNGNDAYWARVELGVPVQKTDDGVDYTQIKKKLGGMVDGVRTPVPMVRNFCKITVEYKPNQSVADDPFKLTGFRVINTMSHGTVVPYMSGESHFGEFIADARNPLSYSEIVNSGYTGVRAAGSRLENTDVEKTDPQLYTSDAKYMYERPYQADNHTYVLVKGLWRDKDTYYKIDLGYADQNKLFAQYNLLRNVLYKVKITNVECAGYDTPQEAAEKPAVNNFSAAVETDNMLNLSDGQHMIFVNFTNYIITSSADRPVFKFSYYNLAANGGLDTNANDQINYDTTGVGIETGSVIAGYTTGTVTEDGLQWVTLTITPTEVTNQLKEQQFTIYDGEGLSRTIKLISKTSWAFEHMNTYPGLFENFDDSPWDWSTEREVGQSSGSPLTLFFELPDNLPQVMFPLQFVIESDKQNITNAYVGNATVQTSPKSLFENVQDTRIQYVKTVEWSDYDTASGNYPLASHIVRCRFLTTTDLAQDGVGDNDNRSQTTLRVYNPYFGTADDTFVRDLNTSDPSPSFWDFSVSNTYTGLNISNAANYNAAGYYSVNGRTSSIFSFSYKYPAPIDRVAKVVITASNGTNTAGGSVGVTVDGTNLGTITPPQDATFSTMETKEFYIAVPNTSTTITLNISSAGAMRFYKIEFYPYVE